MFKAGDCVRINVKIFESEPFAIGDVGIIMYKLDVHTNLYKVKFFDGREFIIANIEMELVK